MDEYINEGADIFNEPPKKKGFTFGKLIKLIMLLLIITVYGILFARCMMSNDSPLVKKVLVDEEFLEAYQENTENFQVLQYGIRESWAAIRDNRLIEFNYLYYVPMARQMQFSVKFNLDLPQCEYDEAIPFKFRLHDSDGNEYTDYSYEYTKKYNFGYNRLCFKGIDLEKADELDENGTRVRNKYTLYVDMVDKNGNYSEISATQIYDGSEVSRPVEFEPELNY